MRTDYGRTCAGVIQRGGSEVSQQSSVILEELLHVLGVHERSGSCPMVDSTHGPPQPRLERGGTAQITIHDLHAHAGACGEVTGAAVQTVTRTYVLPARLEVTFPRSMLDTARGKREVRLQPVGERERSIRECTQRAASLTGGGSLGYSGRVRPPRATRDRLCTVYARRVPGRVRRHKEAGRANAASRHPLK